MRMFVRNEIKARARLNRGLLNILADDIDMLNIDADNLNLFTIGESIKETKDTLVDIMENLYAMEDAVATLKEVKQWNSLNEWSTKLRINLARRSDSRRSYYGPLFYSRHKQLLLWEKI